MARIECIVIQLAIVFLLFGFVNGRSIGNSVDNLVTCSKFDFEEKILEKQIRIEHTIELNKVNMAEWETRIDEKLNEIDKKTKKIMTEVKWNVKDKLKQMDEGFENISSIVTEKQTAALIDLEQKFGLQTKRMDESLQTINDTFKTVVVQTKTETENQQKMASDAIQEIKDNSFLLSTEVTQMMSSVNKTVVSYIQSIVKGSDQVAITSSARQQSYSAGSFITFPTVHVKRNVSDTVITALGRTGTFTCEQEGLYLISVFIMTDTKQRYAVLYKNKRSIGYLYLYLQGTYQSSSVTVLEHLKINDTVHVKVQNSEMFVYGNHHSCITILQL